MELNNGFLIEPEEMIDCRLNGRSAAWTESVRFSCIEPVAEAHVQYPREHSHVLDRGLRMRWDFDSRREFHLSNEGNRLIERPVQYRDVNAGSKPRRLIQLATIRIVVGVALAIPRPSAGFGIHPT